MNELLWQNAKIDRAFIGIEGHGIFAWCLVFAGSSWVQGNGTRGLAPESLPTLKAIVSHFGDWNDLPGKMVRVGRDKPGGPIVAMCDLLDDAKVVRFDDD